ncbi:MAG: hypothetical protein NZ483_07140 [Verrucomicrobiae bacterium]|nr:hypothetical protein [Verrucomicrobiae bacterium]MDW8344192.1 hypothetical protein [Verrucomicrobiae bacterium]
MMSYLTGWVLLAVMLVLTLFNARKKLPFLPMLSARVWLVSHIALGFFSAAIFVWHAGWPHGWFNWLLTAVYAAVMISGVVGWIWSRTIPRQLTALGEEVIWETIPARRAQLRAQAEAMAITSPVVGRFYLENLSGSWTDAERNLRVLRDTLGETERALADRLAAILREDALLATHYRLQGRLKGWLFVHIPLTYALLVLTAAHVIVVYAFSRGAP